MAYFGHFWANFMHVVHKVKFVVFCTKPKIATIIYCIRLIFAVLHKNSGKNTIYYMCFVMDSYLATEGDTADRESGVPAAAARGADLVRIEAQVVGVVASDTNRGPVEAVVACEVQVVAWVDVAAPDKHQRRPHNSIRIS